MSPCPTPTPRLTVPLPGGALTGTPAELQAAAAHIRHELRRLGAPGAWLSVYTVRLPGGRKLTGSPAILLRLADRIAAAATPATPAGLAGRARVAPLPTALALHPAPLPHATVHLGERGAEHGTQVLSDPYTDPTDPDAPPGNGLERYWGCVWAPDAASPQGYRAVTAEVEVWEHSIRDAAVRLAVREAVELATDEVLAVRWHGADVPTCFLDATQVRYACARLGRRFARRPASAPPARGWIAWLRSRR